MMLKAKKILYLSVFMVLFSCGQYHKVTKKGTIEQKYAMGVKMYDTENYSKSLKLLEQIVKGYAGKPQLERIQYLISDSYYKTEQYTLSAYYFDRFVTNFPKSSKAEEAMYMAAYSLYLSSPVFSLDQTDTVEALSSMQAYIDKYPNSVRISEANEVIKELRYKLERKAFEVAKQYYRIGDYTAAITSFDILMSDYLGTTFREEALYYKFMASYNLAMKSVFSKKEARLNSAVKAHEKFTRNYPNSEHIKEVDKLLENLNDKLEDFSLLVIK